MDNKKLENKALSYKDKWAKVKDLGLNPDGRSEAAVDKALSEYENKSSDKFIVIKSFCGIKEGIVLTIDNPVRAKHMLKQGYVKKQDK